MSAAKSPPAPLNPEKLALRGEPTARTLIENLLLAADDKLKLRKLVETIAAARAYLSTRAQPSPTDAPHIGQRFDSGAK